MEPPLGGLGSYYTVVITEADVRAGLCREGQKELPCRYFYDDLGSKLFEAICELPEYGLFRADERILRTHADEILKHVPSPVVVAELGSGSGRKTRWILESLRRRQTVTYYAIDLSPLAMAPMEGVHIVRLEHSYLDGLREACAARHDERLLVLFLGSTIGNFGRPADEQFLAQVRALLAPGDALLLGTDLVKPLPQMVAAYNDSLGVTAAFNLNLLARINRELDADFDLRRFRHTAVYNKKEERVEMYLLSLAEQTVNIRALGLTVHFDLGETIWTENCHKYTTAGVRAMAPRAGFRCAAQWVDEEWPFAESLFLAE